MQIFHFTLDESILIVFIDYGNSETKPANEIYPLQESLARLPAMTVACTLAEVRFCYSKMFSFETIVYFRHFHVVRIFGQQKRLKSLVYWSKIVSWKFIFNQAVLSNGTCRFQ